MKQCPICLELFDRSQLFNLTNCPHLFCSQCCANHITSRSDRFLQVHCPQQNCPGTFISVQRLHNNIKSKLSRNTFKNLAKYQDFKQLQKNPNLKPCSVVNCDGVIDLRQNRKVCSRCNQPHCPKCLKVFHNGNCIIDQHDQNMKNSNFQKCPNCSIWVQKIMGCKYIDCKCGTAFCYQCGIRFEDDPCRMRDNWSNEQKIRISLSKLKYAMPEEKIYYLLIPGKIIIQLIAFILLTVSCSLMLLLSLVLALAFMIIVSPFIVIGLACTAKGFGKILAFILSPILAVSLSLFFIVALLFYPILRKTYHHGIYDGLDTYINKMALLYIKAVDILIKW